MYFQNKIKMLKGETPGILNGTPFNGILRLICPAQDPALLRTFTAAAASAGIACVFPVPENEGFGDIPCLRWRRETLCLPADSFGAGELARILGIKGIQREVLESVFLIADKEELPVITVSDLSFLLEEILQAPAEYQGSYGNLASSSLRTLLRSMRRLEGSDLNPFFGSCSLTAENGLKISEGGRGFIHQMELPPGDDAFFKAFVRALTKQLERFISEENGPVRICLFLPARLADETDREFRLLTAEAQRAGILFCLYGPTERIDADKAAVRAAFTMYDGGSLEEISSDLKRFFSTYSGEESSRELREDEILLAVRGQKPKVFGLEYGICFPEMPVGDAVVRMQKSSVGAGELLSKRRRERAERRQALETEEKKQKLLLEQEKLEQLREKARLREEKEARLEKERQQKERQRKLAPLTRFGNSVISSIGREIGRSLYRSAVDLICRDSKKKS